MVIGNVIKRKKNRKIEIMQKGNHREENQTIGDYNKKF